MKKFTISILSIGLGYGMDSTQNLIKSSSCYAFDHLSTKAQTGNIFDSKEKTKPRFVSVGCQTLCGRDMFPPLPIIKKIDQVLNPNETEKVAIEEGIFFQPKRKPVAMKNSKVFQNKIKEEKIGLENKKA
jgi:hypothetical protein